MPRCARSLVTRRLAGPPTARVMLGAHRACTHQALVHYCPHLEGPADGHTTLRWFVFDAAAAVLSHVCGNPSVTQAGMRRPPPPTCTIGLGCASDGHGCQQQQRLPPAVFKIVQQLVRCVDVGQLLLLGLLADQPECQQVCCTGFCAWKSWPLF